MRFLTELKLDIHSVYDSIWNEGIIYKMSNISIAGKTALWIGNRNIKVKW